MKDTVICLNVEIVFIQLTDTLGSVSSCNLRNGVVFERDLIQQR